MIWKKAQSITNKPAQSKEKTNSISANNNTITKYKKQRENRLLETMIKIEPKYETGPGTDQAVVTFAHNKPIYLGLLSL